MLEVTTNYTSTNNVTIGDNIIELNYGGSTTTSGILTKDGTGSSTTSGSLNGTRMIIGKSWKIRF